MQLLQNKTKIVLAILTGIIIFVVIVAVFFWIKILLENRSDGAGEDVPVSATNKQEDGPAVDPEIQEQLDVLEKLRQQDGVTQMPTEQQVEEQIEQLESVQEEAGIKELPTQEEVEKQLKLLEEMKSK